MSTATVQTGGSGLRFLFSGSHEPSGEMQEAGSRDDPRWKFCKSRQVRSTRRWKGGRNTGIEGSLDLEREVKPEGPDGLRGRGQWTYKDSPRVRCSSGNEWVAKMEGK